MKKDNIDDLNDEFEEYDELIGDEEQNTDIEEIIDKDIEIPVEEDSEMDIMFKFNVNSHKIDGKHSLKRDTIFKGS
jgi:hypothetical protein